MASYSHADLILIDRARRLVDRITAEDCANLQIKEPTPFKKRGQGKSYKPKGGHAPVDFDAVEQLNDLRSVLRRRRPDPELVLAMYLRLRSLVGD